MEASKEKEEMKEELKEEIMKEEPKEEIMEEEEPKKREVAVPGDVIASGTNFLPGEGTKREGNDIISNRFGLVQREGRLVKMIPLSGVYIPRVGNVIIGEVVDIMFNGWQLDINSPYMSFLPIIECQGFINKRDDLSSYFDFGDMIVAKILGIKPRGIDLTMRDGGMRKLQGGIIIHINANKVPRIIGKKGSMINIIKEKTGCEIIVGQNGIIWINGESVNHELLAKKAINLIVNMSFVDGLTEKVEEFLKEHGKNLKITKRFISEEAMGEPAGEERGEYREGFDRGGEGRREYRGRPGGFRGRGGFRPRFREER